MWDQRGVCRFIGSFDDLPAIIDMHGIGLGVEEEPEPECRCVRVDVDREDARDCPAPGPNSPAEKA